MNSQENALQQMEKVWSREEWQRLELRMKEAVLRAGSEAAALSVITRQARAVMRNYTTSFFIVSRFLPPAKREQIEIIYSAVRYPDEIVDSFPLGSFEKFSRLEKWREFYEIGLDSSSLTEAIEAGVPCFLAAFTDLVRLRQIPAEYYHAFIDAMISDTRPHSFQTLDDLINDYIYGSAVVVGYFLTYVYGSRREKDFPDALRAARDLGIALQLTNFLRDVAEDQQRGRLYLPLEMLREEGLDEIDVGNSRQQQAISQVVRRLSVTAAEYYANAAAGLDAFSPDCHLAIESCIKVYGRLNERVAAAQNIHHRQSVPLKEKFQILPPSKYWRIPLAYLIR